MSRMFVFSLLALLSTFASTARAVDENVYFTESYQGVGLSGELIGLNLDANGNGTNVDPTEVLLFSVPPNVGITASPGTPYVFVPDTFEQYHEDNFTHIISLLSSTTPGTYGFNVQNGQISTLALDLTLVNTANQVDLFFNAGGFTTGAAPNYGITADGETDYFWPTVDSSVSFTTVPEPSTTALLLLAVAALLFRGPLLSKFRRVS